MNSDKKLEWEKVRNIFQTVWGYKDFRPPQGEIVECLISQKDALIIMPTGGGKSICFQLPALLQRGLTIVVSPLVALMENQVQELQQRRINAALLHSQLAPYQRRKILFALEQEKLRLLYLSPETLLSPPVWERLSKPHLKINALILDEAHCLVQWGDTFRPAYRRLGAVREALLKSKPENTVISVAAFTATADPLGQKTIQGVLKLQRPKIFKQNPYRPNLCPRVSIAWTPQGRRKQLLKFIEKRASQAGLVYVRTRRDAEEIALWLGSRGYNTSAYHGGLSAEERRSIETNWLSCKMPFVVCTNAFGMGINHSSVRWIVHFHPPHLLSEYVQEIGRAGRDGKSAEALTLISEPTGLLDDGDKQRQRFFSDGVQKQQLEARQILKKLPREGNVDVVGKQFTNGAIALSLLHSMGQLEWIDPFNYIINEGGDSHEVSQIHAAKQMQQYLHTKQCRWQFLLKAFGFDREALNWRCGHCENCIH
jgi:ATP-dependent DNA helicase RecQ